MSKKLSFKTYTISMALIFMLGLAFIGGLYYFLNFYGLAGSKILRPSMEKGPITKEPASLTLDLTTPDDDSLVFQNQIEFSGKTAPGSQVLISSAETDTVVISKQDGSFTNDFDLNEGVNEIKVAVFDKNGEQRETSRTIYYSKEKI